MVNDMRNSLGFVGKIAQDNLPGVGFNYGDFFQVVPRGYV
jgi:hypothetical protein